MNLLKIVLLLSTIRLIEMVKSEPTIVTICEDSSNPDFYSCTAIGANGARLAFQKKRRNKPSLKPIEIKDTGQLVHLTFHKKDKKISMKTRNIYTALKYLSTNLEKSLFDQSDFYLFI
jgi:hypothetical protein